MMTYFRKVFGISGARQHGLARQVRPALETLEDRNLCSAVGTSLADSASVPAKTEQASLLGVGVYLYTAPCARLPPIGFETTK